MRKPITTAVFGIILCLGLTGCNGDETSPQGVLEMMGAALRSGSLADFQGCLSGDALKIYGTAAGMSELRAETSGLELTVGDPLLVAEQPTGNGIVRETYEIPVLSRRASSVENFSRLLNAQVICEAPALNPQARANSAARSAFFMAPPSQSASPTPEAAPVCHVTELAPA